MRAISYLACLCLLLSIAVKAQNRVMHFEGGEEMIHIESPISGSGDFTAEIWYRGDVGLNGRAALFGWNPSSGSGGIQRFIILQSGNRINVLDYSLNNGSSFVRPGFPISADGEWHHIAVIKSGDQITLVWDGDRIYRYTTEQSSPFDLQSLLTIARPNGATWDSWDGEMDEFRVWDYARTTDEIRDNKDCIISRSEPGLVLYYDFQNTIQFVGQDLVPDRTFPQNGGIMFDFAEAGDNNLISEDIGVSGACSPSQNCVVSYSVDRVACSSTYTFVSDQEDSATSYMWSVTGGGMNVDEQFATQDLIYTFDWRFIGDASPYEVCLTLTFEDGCEDQYCESFSFSAQQQQDAVHYEIVSEPSDLTVAASSVTCTAQAAQSAPSITVCDGSSVKNTYTRSDGLPLSAAYEIGVTTITILSRIVSNSLLEPVLVFNYQVIVEEVEGCCDQVPDLSQSLIPNPDFEDTNCIPTQISQIECANGWIQANDSATADLINVTNKSWIEAAVGSVPNPPNGNDNIVGMHYNYPNTLGLVGEYVEYVGACLESALVANTEYTFQASFGSSGGGGNWSTTGYRGDIVFLGIPDCNMLPLDGRDCKEDDLEEVGRVSLDIPPNSWLPNKVDVMINGSEDYEAIMFGPSCNPYPESDDGLRTYLLVDELLVVPGTISSCDPCDPNAVVDITNSLIPNADFEILVPGSNGPTEPADLDQAADWSQATGGTSDLYSVPDLTFIDAVGFVTASPNGTSNFLGFYSWESAGIYEYVGACLLEPFLANETYTMSAYFGASSGDLQNGVIHSGEFLGDVVVLGIPFCPTDSGETQWQTGVFSGVDCKEDSFDEIGRISLAIEASSWLPSKRDIEISPIQDYQAIMFGVACGNTIEPFTSRRNYLLIDEIFVRQGEACEETSDCFTVMNEQISCLDHDTWEVTLQLRNDNDQIFDRLLTFAQQPGTAISPSLSIDFGTGIDMVPPGDISGEMTFQIRRQDFVAEEVEVCFDVIPQNPQGGDCCKDDFCVTLPVCCVPEETTSIDFNMNTESEDCCYDLEVSNLCAEDYFTGLLGGVVGEGITLIAEGQNGWTAETVPFFGTELIAFYFGDEIDQNFVPILEVPTLIATVCLDGVTSENVDDQQFNITWANIGEDGENGEFAFGEEFITECEPAPCNLVFNPTITCDDENNYQLTFLLQMSEDEMRVAQQLVINPLGNTQVSQYSPQTFDDVMLSPGEMRSFTIDLQEVDQGETFEFSVTMHDFNTPLDDGTYWCCYTGQEVSMSIPPCIQGGQGPTDPPGIQLEPAELIALAKPLSYVVYPNPVQDVFTLAFEQPTEEALALELINMQGELITTREIEEGAERYSLSMREALPAIYFIRIRSEEHGTLSYRKILKL